MQCACCQQRIKPDDTGYVRLMFVGSVPWLVGRDLCGRCFADKNKWPMIHQLPKED